MKRLTLWTYPTLVGVLLGLMQTGLFFQLSFKMSSSFRTFLMVTICWLIGSAVGVQLARRWGMTTQRLNRLAIGALGAYLGCAVLVNAAPFDTQLWPIYALLIVLSGVYPGAFFVQMSTVYSARALFFRENNGFIVGMVVGTVLFMLLGRAVLWVAPLVFVGLLLILPTPQRPAPATEAMLKLSQAS